MDSGKVVTCVDWHPNIPGLLVSCSDDGDVRLWRPTEATDSSDEEEEEEEENDVSADSLD